MTTMAEKHWRQINRRIEANWRAGRINWEAFDWWLRWMCGV
jgi:hypothetical protein